MIKAEYMLTPNNCFRTKGNKFIVQLFLQPFNILFFCFIVVMEALVKGRRNMMEIVVI